LSAVGGPVSSGSVGGDVARHRRRRRRRLPATELVAGCVTAVVHRVDRPHRTEHEQPEHDDDAETAHRVALLADPATRRGRP
jgi:hypothetical protein